MAGDFFSKEFTPARILMTADSVGGVWTYALELIRALDRYGAEVLMATMGAPLSLDQRREIKSIPNLHLRESQFRLEWMENPWEDVEKAGEWLLELEKEFQPDLIHLNGYAHGACPWKAPLLVVGHSCVWSWWKAVKKSMPPPSWNRYFEAVQKGLQAADLVVAPTRAMLHELVRIYGEMPERNVIPNGRTPDFFQPGSKEEIIFGAGRLWDEAKNIQALAEVAPVVEWPVYVAGEDRHLDGRKLHWPSTNMLGRLSGKKMSQWFSRAAIYVLPARYEPFGFSPLEAGLSGCALVLGDIPSLREIWDGCAEFVAPGDTTKLGQVLSRLIKEPRHREMRAEQSLARARQFGPERMATQYLEAYARAARRHKEKLNGS